MSEAKARKGGETALPGLIRSQLASPANRHHLARIPAFRLETEMPDRLIALLGELDRVEEVARRARR